MGHFARECPEYTGIRRPDSGRSRDGGRSRSVDRYRYVQHTPRVSD